MQGRKELKPRLFNTLSLERLVPERTMNSGGSPLYEPPRLLRRLGHMIPAIMAGAS